MKRLLSLLLVSLSLAGSLLAAPPPSAPDEAPPVAPVPNLHGHLTVTFTGAEAFSAGQLREGIIHQIQTIEQFGLDAPNAYDAKYYLETFYRRHGYAHVEVSATILGPWTLRLDITEGPLARLGSLTITGAQAFTREKITDYLLGPLREANPRIKRDTELPVDVAALYDGAALVRRLYNSGGFLQAEVRAPVVTFNPDNTSASVELAISEGPQFHFGEIRFTGSPALSREKMLEAAEVSPGDVFTEGRLRRAVRAIASLYQKSGYFTATVTSASDLEEAREGRVPVGIEVVSGPLCHFDGATVSGTRDVKPAFIRNRLRSLKSETYSPGAIEKAFRELNKTGLFKNITMIPKIAPNDTVRLDVDVEEAKPREFGFGLGYASYYGGLVSASYRDLNFFGTARPFSTEVTVSQKSINGELVYTDPWFLESDYGVELRLFIHNDDLKGYSNVKFGFRPTVTRQITPHWQVAGFFSAKYVTTYDIDISPADLVGREDYSVVSVGLSQTLDYRNNTTLPNQGTIFSTSFEFAPQGIGQVPFLRGLARFSWYLPVTSRSTLALGARGGIIAPLGGEGLPIDERFFNGGSTTVRSYSEFTLGPRDHAGYPLGGETFTVFNAEYTFPIYGNLYGAVFVDAGNTIAEAKDFGLENMRYAVGAGLRYNLPIGSLRFDYGYNPDRQPGDAIGAFHFAVGVAF